MTNESITTNTMYHEKGHPIIDELKICYVAGSELLEELKTIDYGCYKIFPDFSFQRTVCQHFEYAFNIYTVGDVNHLKVASGVFGRLGDMEDSPYFFFRVENWVLYDHEALIRTMGIPEQLDLAFHNFTSLDIAIDTGYDIALMMKRLWRRDDITTIINGKAVVNRKAIVPELKLTYSTSLERMKGLTVYVKQRKAAFNKKKGITVQAYNKRMEIDNSSGKNYISEYYNNPKRLYRIEVHLNHPEISDYCKTNRIVEDDTLIRDSSRLSDMFYYHLSAVIRFTKGRKKLLWQDIIQCNGRV